MTSNSTPEYTPKRKENTSTQNLVPEVFPALFITAREWKQSKRPLTDEWRNKIGNMLSKRNQSKTNKRHWQSGSSSRAPA
jgi:hypothetical protein